MRRNIHLCQNHTFPCGGVRGADGPLKPILPTTFLVKIDALTLRPRAAQKGEPNIGQKVRMLRETMCV